MKNTARAAARLGVRVVNGFTGSSIWPDWYFFPPTSPQQVKQGFDDFANRWGPILDVFSEVGVKFALEVHPAEIAYDIYSTETALEAVGHHEAFCFNFDPSHLLWQGVDPVKFIDVFGDRIVHAHMKDVTVNHDGMAGVLGSHLPFGDHRRGWDFRSVGRGDVDFDGIIRALNRVGYDGPLSVEWEDRTCIASTSAGVLRLRPIHLLPDHRGGLRRRLLQGMNRMTTYQRPLRMGMVGGGRDAFIGAVHRKAAALDGEIVLVAVAVLHAGEVGRERRDLGLDPDRCYPDWETMLEAERNRPEADRIDFVSVVTPNHMHYPVARAFVEAGFHVVCDKPMTLTTEEADSLADLVADRGVVFCVTYNYSGYPMVKQARHLVRTGAIGDIRKVVVEYNQGWLATDLESTGQKQADWRTDPDRSGPEGRSATWFPRRAAGVRRHRAGDRITALGSDELRGRSSLSTTMRTCCSTCRPAGCWSHPRSASEPSTTFASGSGAPVAV